LDREIGFLEYNFDNIMRNLIATEVHLRDLSNEREKGHDSCCRKHLLFIENELGEAQSHSAVLKPELVRVFKELEKEVINLRKNLSSQSVIESIRKIRDIRKKMERINPEYDTSNCISCKKIEREIEKKIKQKSKVYKGESKNNIIDVKILGGRRMDTRQIGIIAGGQFLGKGADLLANYIDTTMKATGKQLYERPSTWINIGGGLGLVLAALYGLKDEKLKLGAIVAGTHMLTKTIDYLQEYTAAPTARGLAAPMALTLKPVASTGGKAIAGL